MRQRRDRQRQNQTDQQGTAGVLGKFHCFRWKAIVKAQTDKGTRTADHDTTNDKHRAVDDSGGCRDVLGLDHIARRAEGEHMRRVAEAENEAQ